MLWRWDNFVFRSNILHWKKIRLSLAMKQCKVFSNNFSIFYSIFSALDDKRCFLCSLANNCLLFQNTDNSWEKSTQNAMDKNMATFYRNYHIIWFSLLWLNKCFIGPNRMPNDECAKDMVNFPLEIPFLGSLLYFVFLSFVGSTAHFHLVIWFCCPFSMCLFGSRQMCVWVWECLCISSGVIGVVIFPLSQNRL